MMLANAHMAPVIGIDIHIIVIPPGVPTPLPHPYIGMVMDPMDYVPVIGSTIMINGKPRGNAGTSGVLGSLFHIPLGGPFAMAPMIGHDSMNFFGSPKTVAQGSYMSAAGFMVMTCNDIGAPLTLKPGKKMKPVPSLYLPSSATIPIPAGKPVMVGGPYVPDLVSMAMGLVMSYGMGAMLKGAGRGLAKLNKSVLQKFKATNGLGKKLCKLGFEPVDLITGRVLYDGVDFEIPGVIPLTWERNWYSDSDYEGLLGHGQHCNYDIALHIEKAEDSIVMRLPDGRVTPFPYLIAEGDSFYSRSEKLTLTRLQDNEYSVKNHESQLTTLFNQTEDALYRPSKIENNDGFCIQFFYNAIGRLEQIIDTVGRRINTELDSEGRITKISATHNGSKRLLIKYSYNKEGDLVGITDALDQTTKMEFINHLMVKKTDRNGMSFFWEYDGNKTSAKCIKTWGDEGVLAGSIEYGKGMNVVTNSLGHETTYYFDSNNLCIQVTDAEGGHTFHEFTEFMEPYRDIDEEGNITGYMYDDKGNRTTTIRPDGTQLSNIYDEDGKLILTKLPGGGSLSRTYINHQVKSTTSPEGKLCLFEYNPTGLLTSVQDNAGNETRLFYDDDCNLNKLLINGEVKSEWFHDAWGRCISHTNAESRTESFSYDAIDRVQRIQKRDKDHIKFKYNAYHDVIAFENSQKDVVEFEYTPMGNLKKRIENGSAVHFKYNTDEQLVAVLNEVEEYYRFGRDRKGQIINETGFDGLRKDFIRDKAGKIVKIERPDSKFSKFEHDLNGNITRIEHNDGSWQTYRYDSNGLIIEAANQNSRINFIRDEEGKVVEEHQDEYNVLSSYDSLGNRIKIESSLGAEFLFDRNQLGAITGISASMGQNESWEAHIQLNSLGQELERILPGKLINKVSYDSSGRPTNHSVARGGRATMERKYAWSVTHKLRSMTNELTNGVVNYSYDAFGNLASARYEDRQFDFKLPDEVGNLYSTKSKNNRKYGSGGRLMKENGNNYTYDGEGNLVKKVTPQGTTEYSWNADGMLTAVEKPDNTKIEFEYDAVGRRTAKIRHNHRDSNRSTITRWLWDGHVPIHEWSYPLKERPSWVIGESNVLEKDSPEPLENLITWVFNERTHKPAAKMIGGERYSIITDYLGTPIEMYNSKGERTWQVEYDIYGNIRNVLKGSKSDCPFRFQGQYEDDETGLYYNRHRYYSPENGVYISQDPIGLHGGDNLYAYTHDCNSWVDPLGLDGLNFLQELANDAHSTLGKSQGFSTTAVGVDANGNYFVSSSSPYVPGPIKKWADDMGVEVVQSKKPNVHAEEALIKSNNGIVEIEPNRAVCSDCEGLMNKKKIKFETATSGKKSKNRMPGGKYAGGCA